MSVGITRWQSQQVTSPDHVLCEASLTFRHRITIFSVIFVVVVVLVYSGHSVSDALGLVMAVGAAAAQVGLWLSGQSQTAGSARGA
ncbi:hypothetical protein OG780_43915 [Streptomyces sp. NBC_00386]|jgi:hypothetical protein|uniref:hypothetical protein n=1 Tax=Streptomyces sp. NBC_00386 TaxID=2975734 RepID=UPI002E21C54B